MTRLLTVFAVALVGCSTLPDRTETCGNGVIDRGESCDSSSDLCKQCRLSCPAHTDEECMVAGSGYRCGADDVCHAPSGVFQQAETASSFLFPVGQGQVADLDGDRIGDIVGFSDINIDVRFGDLTTEFATRATAVVPFTGSIPAVRSFPGFTRTDTGVYVPPRSDILLPTADGLAAYTARGKSLVAYPFANAPGARGACVTQDRTADLVAAFSIDKHHLGFVSRDHQSPYNLKISILDPTTNDCLKITTPCTLDPIIEPSQAGVTVDHYEIEISPPSSLIINTMIAVTVPTSMTTSDSCVVRVTDDQNAQPRMASTQIASLSTAIGPLTFARGEPTASATSQCPGLYAPSSAPSRLAVFQPELSAPMSATDCSLINTPTPIDLPALPGLLLPAGRIPLVPAVMLGSSPVRPTGPDAIAIIAGDLLAPTTYIFALEGFTQPAPLYHSTRPLYPLRSADLNGDGIIEGVAMVGAQGLGGQPDLDILYRTPGGVNSFVTYRIPTASVPTHMEIGDFDGNSLDDIAYTERIGGEERLMIAYGTPDRPLDPVEVATFTHVVTLQRLDLPDSLEPSGQVLDDLVIADVTEQGQPPQLTILHGNPQRSMLAYYVPQSAPPAPDYTGTLVAAIAGDFDATTPVQDVVMFEANSKPDRVTMWIATGKDGSEALLDPAVALPAPQISNAACTAQQLCLQNARIVPWHLARRDVMIAVDPPVRDGARTRKVFLIDPSSRGPAGELVITQSPITIAPAQIVFSIWGADIDNTAGANLVMSLGSFGELGAAMDDQVLDCQVNDKGLPTACTRLEAEVPDLATPQWTCTAAEMGRVRAAGRLDEIPTTTSTDMLVLCKHPDTMDGTLFRVAHDGMSLRATAVLVDDAGGSVPVFKFKFISVGDFNGDRVDDVAGISFDEISGLPHVAIHPQCAADDLDCIDRNAPNLAVSRESP